MKPSSRVVITGATGFIGRAVLEELLSPGDCEVTVLLRPDSDRRRLPQGDYTVLEYRGLNDPGLETALKARRPGVFIHCAWRGVSAGGRNEAFQITENLPLTLQSVELAAGSGCGQWIGLGSQAEYGRANARVNEEAATRPETLYGKGKLAAGIAALALCEARGLAGSWLRVFSVYGPGDAPSLFIPYVIQEFLAGRVPRLTACEQLWDYLYITDMARAVTAVAAAGARGVFNVGSGRAVSLKTCIETIRGVLGTGIVPEYGALPYRADQVMHLEADISRLTAATGWRPVTDLVEGLAATVDFERRREASPAAA